VLLSTALLGSTALLVSAEETPAAVRARAGRLGTVPAALLILSATDLDDALAAIEEHRPSLVVLDSIQTLRAAGAPGTAGSLAQVRAVVEQLGEAARSSGRPSWSSGTSRKRATRPGRAPWSTWSTPSSPSRATGTTGSASRGP